MYDIVGYVTFVNVPSRKVGGGHREIFVKVFEMAPRPEDGWHERYKSSLGFAGPSAGIENYSFGIHIVRYPGMMEFNAGRIKAGSDKRVAYSLMDSVLAKGSVASITSFLLTDPDNADFFTNPDGTHKFKIGLSCPIPNDGGACGIYLIWEGSPVGDIRYHDLREMLITIGGKGLKMVSYSSLCGLQQ